MAAADLQGVTVLLVEDDHDTREALAACLRLHAAEVLEAACAQDAFLLLETRRPDLILSDLGMPDIDGYELMQAVRALPPERGGRIPSIAVTAHDRPDDRRRSLRAGYLLHVAKPVDPGGLVRLVAATVRAEARGGGRNEG